MERVPVTREDIFKRLEARSTGWSIDELNAVSSDVLGLSDEEFKELLRQIVSNLKMDCPHAVLLHFGTIPEIVKRAERLFTGKGEEESE